MTEPDRRGRRGRGRRGRRRGPAASGRASASTRSGSPPGDGSVVTLRCYLDDAPVFLGSDGRIDVFPHRAARWPAGSPTTAPRATTWPPPPPGRRSSSRPAWASWTCEVDELNAYTLTGLADDIAEGTLSVDPAQLELATELLLDVGDWAGDDAAAGGAGRVAGAGLAGLVHHQARPDPAGPEPAVRRRERPVPRAGGRAHGAAARALSPRRSTAQASSAAYPGLITSLISASRSSKPMNADFMAFTVNHCRSAQP